MLVRTILQSGLATLLCLAVIAVAQPVAAQDDATPEELAREAARLATPMLDDAANGLLENPGAFVKVAEAPKVGAAEAAAVSSGASSPVLALAPAVCPLSGSCWAMRGVAWRHATVSSTTIRL